MNWKLDATSLVLLRDIKHGICHQLMQSALKQLVPTRLLLERIACHLAQRTHDFPRAVRFCQKAAARGQIFGAQVRPSRCGNDFNGRPPASHGRGQLKTVHGTRHMDLKTTVMSGRRSRISMASSASFASMTSKPPDLIISIASMRMRNSSSTIRTTARWFVSEYAKSNVSHCTQALWMSLVPRSLRSTADETSVVGFAGPDVVRLRRKTGSHRPRAKPTV